MLVVKAGKPRGMPQRRGKATTSYRAWEVETRARAGGDAQLEGVAAANPVVLGKPRRVGRWEPQAVRGRV